MNALLMLTAALAPALLADLPQPRAQAAQTLREQIEPASEAGSFPIWLAVARTAIEKLGSGEFSATLEEAILEARWLDLTDSEQAAQYLEAELRAVLIDLEFEPLLEAELPVGFPAPTPVRDIELKSYPDYRRVRADMRGSGSNLAFWKLFSHIKKHDIAMTAPVETTYGEEAGKWRETEMSFLYASPDMGSPGQDGYVEVVDQEPALFLSLGCRGRMNQASLETAGERLMDWIDQQEELELIGELRSMGYNSPMVPSSRSYFEVQVQVQKRAMDDSNQVVFDFGAASAIESWAPVNDSVMGGRSWSRFVATDEDSSVFEGNVSLENNGGFASVRSRPAEMELDGANALVLSFRGDGKTYKLRLRTSNQFDGVSYETVFATEAETWQTVSFPIDEFIPVWRGRLVRGAAQLAGVNIRSVGLMISDKQTGAFRLEVASLKAH